ncbi:hypothetical protein P3S68_019131 [Capsicum galapagoense]
MKPPEIHKIVGRPKVLREKEKNKARKREEFWSKSRKGLKMTCGYYGAISHNSRTCPILQRREEALQDVALSAPQPSEESIFMPTLGFSASSSQHISQSIDEVVGPSNKKRKAKDKLVAPSKRFVKNNIAASSIVQKTIATLKTLVDEDETRDELEVEDEQPLHRPRALTEAKTRLKIKKLQQKPTATKKINFRGDENGVSITTNLPYSPRNMTWKGKSCVTSSQLATKKEKKISKLKTKRGKH